MFMEQVASLDLVQRDNDVLKENDMFFSERDSKPTDDTGKNVKQLRCTIELDSASEKENLPVLVTERKGFGTRVAL
jgi:hypothetical protein